MPGTLICSDNVETFQDTNKNWTTSNVTIVGDLGGTLIVNYLSGSVSVTFNTAPANAQVIYLSYALFNPGLPQNVLMFNNQLQFSPVPNTAYTFQCKAYKVTDLWLMLLTDHLLMNGARPLRMGHLEILQQILEKWIFTAPLQLFTKNR